MKTDSTMEPTLAVDDAQRIEKLQAELAEAQAAAESRKRLIEDLESRVRDYGKFRQFIARFESEFSLPSAKQCAENVFESFQNRTTNPSPSSEQNYRLARATFAEVEAIRPHVKAKQAALESEAREMADAIHKAAQEIGVEVTDLLRSIRAEAAPNRGRHHDAELWQLVAGGFFDGLLPDTVK